MLNFDPTLTVAMGETRAQYISAIRAVRAKQVSELYVQLEAAGWDADKVAPHPTGSMGKAAYRASQARYSFVRKWTANNWPRVCRSMHEPDSRKPRPDLEGKLDDEAEIEGGRNFDSFVAKLSGKIGKPVQSAGLVGSLWNGCTLTVVTEDRETQVWHTQCIINRSVYAKLFNQWPTRRIS